MSTSFKRNKAFLFSRRSHCQWCGVAVDFKKTSRHNWRSASADHILAHSRGGGHRKYNLKLACMRCNNGREMFNECIGAFACATAVYGDTISLVDLKDKMLDTGGLQTSKASTRRIAFKQLGFLPQIPKTPVNRLSAQLLELPVVQYSILPDTKILYEGTKKFQQVMIDYTGRTHWKNRNIVGIMFRNKQNLLASGYQAVWLLKYGLLHF